VSVVLEKASIRRRSRIPCVVVKKYALASSWKKLRRVDVKAQASLSKKQLRKSTNIQQKFV